MMRSLTRFTALAAVSLLPALAGAVQTSALICTQVTDGETQTAVQCCYTNGAVCKLSIDSAVVKPATWISFDQFLAPYTYTLDRVPTGYDFDKWVLTEFLKDNFNNSYAYFVYAPQTLDEIVSTTNILRETTVVFTKASASTIKSSDPYLLLAPCFSWLKYNLKYWDYEGSSTIKYAGDFIYTNEVTIAKNTTSCEGYDFAGWALSPNAEEAQFTEDETVTGVDLNATTNGVNLYAVWKPIPPPEPIEVVVWTGTPYRGTVTPSGTNTVDEGASLSFSATPAPGYTFAGWSDGEDAAEREITPITNSVYVASFAPIDFTVTNNFPAASAPVSVPEDASVHIYLLANGGEGSIDPLVIERGSAVALPANTFEFGARPFLGWARDAHATAVVEFANGATMTPQDDITILYAVWGDIVPVVPQTESLELTIKSGWTRSEEDGKVVYEKTRSSSSAEISASVAGPGTLTFKWWAPSQAVGGAGGEKDVVTFSNSVSAATMTLRSGIETNEVSQTVETAATFTWRSVAFGEAFVGFVYWTPELEPAEEPESATQTAYIRAYKSFALDGTKKTGVVAVAGCNLGGTVTSSQEGEFTATATLCEGYVWSDGGTYTSNIVWSVVRCAYDMSAVSLTNATFAWDSSAKALAITGELPDGVSVEYDGNDKVDCGRYTVTARFTRDRYHTEIPDLSAALTIVAADGGDPEVTDFRPAEDGGFSLGYSKGGSTYFSYTLWSSTNLVDWTCVSNLVFEGAAEISLEQETEVSAKFWKIVAQ